MHVVIPAFSSFFTLGFLLFIHFFAPWTASIFFSFFRCIRTFTPLNCFSLVVYNKPYTVERIFFFKKTLRGLGIGLSPSSQLWRNGQRGNLRFLTCVSVQNFFDPQIGTLDELTDLVFSLNSVLDFISIPPYVSSSALGWLYSLSFNLYHFLIFWLVDEIGLGK